MTWGEVFAKWDPKNINMSLDMGEVAPLGSKPGQTSGSICALPGPNNKITSISMFLRVAVTRRVFDLGPVC